MPKSCLVDSGVLAALLDSREQHHGWTREVLLRQPTPWLTCDAVLAETYFLLHRAHAKALDRLLREGILRLEFDLGAEIAATLALRAKYADVPMSLADACMVRMSEILPDPVVVTTDSDFRIYRRHGRKIVPCLMP